eukprot:5340152-Pyramimonas_sp.AAC.1
MSRSCVSILRVRCCLGEWRWPLFGALVSFCFSLVPSRRRGRAPGVELVRAKRGWRRCGRRRAMSLCGCRVEVMKLGSSCSAISVELHAFAA